MGCCVTFQPLYKAINIENPKILQKKHPTLHFNHPEVLREIFTKKDLEAPKLRLESNKLRNSRLKQIKPFKSNSQHSIN